MVNIDNSTVLTGGEWMDIITDELKEEINKNSFRILERGKFRDFINHLFSWSSSRQGDRYWRDIFDNSDISEYIKTDTVGYTEFVLDPKKIIESYY